MIDKSLLSKILFSYLAHLVGSFFLCCALFLMINFLDWFFTLLVFSPFLVILLNQSNFKVRCSWMIILIALIVLAVIALPTVNVHGLPTLMTIILPIPALIFSGFGVFTLMKRSRDLDKNEN